MYVQISRLDLFYLRKFGTPPYISRLPKDGNVANDRAVINDYIWQSNKVQRHDDSPKSASRLLLWWCRSRRDDAQFINVMWQIKISRLKRTAAVQPRSDPMPGLLLVSVINVRAIAVQSID